MLDGSSMCFISSFFFVFLNFSFFLLFLFFHSHTSPLLSFFVCQPPPPSTAEETSRHRPGECSTTRHLHGCGGVCATKISTTKQAGRASLGGRSLEADRARRPGEPARQIEADEVFVRGAGGVRCIV